MRISAKVAGEELTRVAAPIEPKLRDGLAKSIARRFTSEQLVPIATFFETDAGKAYAAQSLSLFFDKDVILSLISSVPTVVKEFPGIMEKVEKATAHLPKPKKKAPDVTEDTDDNETRTTAATASCPRPEIDLAAGRIRFAWVTSPIGKMMRIKTIFVAGCALLLAPMPAVAAPDAQRIAAAERLLKAQDYDATLDRTITAMIGEMKRTFPQRFNQNLAEPASPELIAQMEEIIERHLRVNFAKHRARMKQAMALIYANHFTAPELDRLASIQADPVMKKMQVEAPAIAAETMGLAQAAWADAEPALRVEIEAAAREYLKSKGQTPGT